MTKPRHPFAVLVSYVREVEAESDGRLEVAWDVRKITTGIHYCRVSTYLDQRLGVGLNADLATAVNDAIAEHRTSGTKRYYWIVDGGRLS